MAATADTTVRSLRATDKVFEKLKIIADEQGFSSQGEALTALVQMWETEQAKILIPDRATEIDNFRAMVHKIESSFINSLEINMNAEERIRQEFEAKLKANDTTINLLQEQKQKLIDEKKQLELDCNTIKDMNIETTSKLTSVTASMEAVKREYDKSLFDKDNLNKVLTSNATKDQEKIDVLKQQLAVSEDYKKELGSKAAEIRELKQQLQSSKTETEQLRNQISELHRAHAHAIQMKDLESKNQLLEAEKNAQLEIDKHQSQFLSRFDALEKKHAAEIERLTKKTLRRKVAKNEDK